jgi:hypothetical protein
MSILNHLGKVKTTYLPYTSKYLHEGKIYHLHKPGPHDSTTISYYVDEDYTQPIFVPLDKATFEEVTKLDLIHGDYHEAKRKFILQDFTYIIKRITKHFTSSIWKSLNISPLFTFQELLWLKVDDINSHVEHLEKILIHVIEENKLLRIDALQTNCLAIGQLEKRLGEENNLLQHRLDALETKCLIGSERLIQVLEENNLLQRKMEQVLKDHVDKILHEMRERDVLYELD